MARFFAPDCRPVLGPVKARPCGRPAAGLDRSCAPAVTLAPAKNRGTRRSAQPECPRFKENPEQDGEPTEDVSPLVAGKGARLVARDAVTHAAYAARRTHLGAVTSG